MTERRGRTKAVEARDRAIPDVQALVEKHGSKAVASALTWLRKSETKRAEAEELRRRAAELDASWVLKR